MFVLDIKEPDSIFYVAKHLWLFCQVSCFQLCFATRGCGWETEQDLHGKEENDTQNLSKATETLMRVSVCQCFWHRGVFWGWTGRWRLLTGSQRRCLGVTWGGQNETTFRCTWSRQLSSCLASLVWEIERVRQEPSTGLEEGQIPHSL